ncbi:MAG: pantoate--beta-alanine ligase [Saprospiraceae bacterium]
MGFAPTMGALHEELALEPSEVPKRMGGVWPFASIFVNPTQFNDPADRKISQNAGKRIPRSLSGGIVLFMPPEVEEVTRRRRFTIDLDFQQLDLQVMEGKFRPGRQQLL